MKIINALIIFGVATLLVGCGVSGGGSSSSNASSLVNPASSQSSSSSVAVSSSAASSESLAAVCDFPAKFSWESTEPLITPKAANHVSIKDPTIVYYNNLYHVFATVFDTSRNAWSAVYLNFS